MPPSVISIHPHQGESDAQATARAAISPSLRGAATLMRNTGADNALIANAVVEALAEQVKILLDPDSQGCESLLATQALCLDSEFHRLLAAANSPDLPYAQRLECARLAQRAQAQSQRSNAAIIKARPKPPKDSEPSDDELAALQDASYGMWSQD